MMSPESVYPVDDRPAVDNEARVTALLAKLTLPEKIGQMSLANSSLENLPESVKAGEVGALLNEVDVHRVNELQRLAIEESRLGIPLLVGRDLIHGFNTIFPIPLGQAATWDPGLVEAGARCAALEGASAGVNWTFSPMIDISRDPRWGRIAESFGEDPCLCGQLGAAMVKGYQGRCLEEAGSIAACPKHFAGYGASEAGIDYNTVNLPESELRNVYLRPFRMALEAGAATIMSSFSDINGVPGAANHFLLDRVLCKEWNFSGFVVSDWDAITELGVHGLVANGREAARAAIDAGVHMEMNSTEYQGHLTDLVESGEVRMEVIDRAVARILAIKFRLGLFERPYTRPADYPEPLNPAHRELAKTIANRSCVLLKNSARGLPLKPDSLESIAVIGPLADDGYEQLGTWTFDGRAEHSETLLGALTREIGGQVSIRHARGCENTRSRDTVGFEQAIALATESDAVILCLGEESILSGEAHCRADISLPGNQAQLVDAIAGTGKPVILVIMAGRPLVLTEVADRVDALLYAWHPGTMGGPAIADLLLGKSTPSGKLPVTFPRAVGQIPIYHARKNTGRPPWPGVTTSLEDIDGRAEQTSLGMSAFHLDAGFEPLYPFGYGLSYTRFEYSNLRLSTDKLRPGETLHITATLRNLGDIAAEEVAQLYVRDLVGDITRPVRELKGFQRLALNAGEDQELHFDLHTDRLAFFNRAMEEVTEPGGFRLWVGGDSRTSLEGEFEIIQAIGPDEDKDLAS